jgi:hypothetical protein
MTTINEKVSGIGSMSERTDLNVSQQPARYISGLPQGQGEATYNQQTAMPMYATPQIEAVGIGALDITPISAESKYPDQDILTGASFSNKGDSALLNLPYQQPTILTTLGKINQNDPTGDTELFMMMFQNRGLG